MLSLEIQDPTSKPVLSCSSSISSLWTIGGANYRNNTDDVGLVAPKVGVDSPKRVRYYFHSRDTFLMSPCYLSRRHWVV
jgi:hypothetical protein